MASKCRAVGCDREATSDGLVCSVCLIQMEVLMRDEIKKRIGRVPSDAEFDLWLDRVLEARKP